MVKIYFDNVDFNSSSGPNTFGSRLATELNLNPEIEIVGKADNYDIFLCFIEPTCQPKSSSKFVQRLDGIWFKPDQFESHNQLIKWAYDNADAVVWQSEFDKNMTTKWWGNRYGRIISNGIKLEEIKLVPEILELKEKFDRIFVCSASWHRQKRLKENIELFLKVAGQNDALIVLGKNPDFSSRDRRILYAGQQTHEFCLQLYYIADWMIHLAWLDHCPNVVVEALSQGCPVICTDSGGTKELVQNNGIVIRESVPYEYQLCDYDNPPSLNFDDFSLSPVAVQKDYLSIKECAGKYVTLFKKLIKN